MPDLFESASAWLGEMLKAHASRSVTYRRGADSAEVAAAIGRTEFEVDDGYGVLQKVQSRDFLVPAADLILSGSLVEPEGGDRIEETVGGQTFVYEVMAPGKEPTWRYSDPYRQTLRIHTKHVETLP